jgi:hypothetical protein
MSKASLTSEQKGGVSWYKGGEHKNSTSKLIMKSEFSHVALSWMSRCAALCSFVYFSFFFFFVSFFVCVCV